MGYLCRFRIDEPPFRISQNDSLQWLALEYARSSKDGKTSEDFLRLLQKIAAKPSQIEYRGHYLPEYRSSSAERLIFQNPGGESVRPRMRFFDEVATGIFSRLFKESAPFEELLHVTCTGYVSPSPAQKWTVMHAGSSTRVRHVYHMGCYAALPAVHAAIAQTGQGHAVEICHTELCSLHLNTRDTSIEEMVVQTLFADGACAYRAVPERPSSEASLRIVKMHEELLPDSLSAMSWSLAEWGLQMTLAKDVPRMVKSALPRVLATGLGINGKEADPKMIWAVHPGGPRILDEIQELFGLADEQLFWSRKVLRERGNMSSATLPHIWNEILLDPSVANGTRIVTMAFGPGLTVSLAELEVVK